jgi:hypothetical protein
MVVDAMDLAASKSHITTFVICSGDSDFSPLVSKLKENDKAVVGVGVKNSTSGLLLSNCDEFIFYEDLVRETRALPSIENLIPRVCQDLQSVATLREARMCRPVINTKRCIHRTRPFSGNCRQQESTFLFTPCSFHRIASS